ncbi:class I SAM-dependent methyltransferase [Nanoarchaeota archaeon]
MDYATYYKDRDKKKVFGYRLRRRTYEAVRAIRKYKGKEVDAILDLGCAEGLMLKGIKKHVKAGKIIGVDYNIDLIRMRKGNKVPLVQGDAHAIPLRDGSVDVVVTTAVIEHVRKPLKVMKEIKRVLKKGGIVVLTSPNPFFDAIASGVGLLKDDTHEETFNLKRLVRLVEKSGLKTLEARRFMISPWGMPKEIKVEKALRKMRLSFSMCNQLVVAKK